jgi:hypothetical protein
MWFTLVGGMSRNYYHHYKESSQKGQILWTRGKGPRFEVEMKIKYFSFSFSNGAQQCRVVRWSEFFIKKIWEVGWTFNRYTLRVVRMCRAFFAI